ncbi:unnamed protein product [Closterium sp. NIES-54]
MVQQVLQRFGFTYSSPQATPLPTRHSLSALPSDESVEPSGPYPELVGCLMYLMTCTRPDLAYPLSILARYVAPRRHRPEHMAAAKRVLRYLCSTSGMGLVLGGRSPVVLTGHADASWADDQATQRSSQGYTFGLGSGSVSWRATRSSSVLGSSCEAEIYAGAMAAQELRRLTYLLTDLGESPRSPPVLYVDNKAMLALCREQRLEHRTKHIALRYFLARELQQRGQLRLAYVASEANTADVFTKALAPSAATSRPGEAWRRAGWAEELVAGLAAGDAKVRLRAVRDVKNAAIGSRTRKLAFIRLRAVPRCTFLPRAPLFPTRLPPLAPPSFSRNFSLRTLLLRAPRRPLSRASFPAPSLPQNHGCALHAALSPYHRPTPRPTISAPCCFRISVPTPSDSMISAVGSGLSHCGGEWFESLRWGVVWVSWQWCGSLGSGSLPCGGAMPFVRFSLTPFLTGGLPFALACLLACLPVFLPACLPAFLPAMPVCLPCVVPFRLVAMLEGTEGAEGEEGAWGAEEVQQAAAAVGSLACGLEEGVHAVLAAGAVLPLLRCLLHPHAKVMPACQGGGGSCKVTAFDLPVHSCAATWQHCCRRLAFPCPQPAAVPTRLPQRDSRRAHCVHSPQQQAALAAAGGLLSLTRLLASSPRCTDAALLALAAAVRGTRQQAAALVGACGLCCAVLLAACVHGDPAPACLSHRRLKPPSSHSIISWLTRTHSSHRSSSTPPSSPLPRSPLSPSLNPSLRALFPTRATDMGGGAALAAVVSLTRHPSPATRLNACRCLLHLEAALWPHGGAITAVPRSFLQHPAPTLAALPAPATTAVPPATTAAAPVRAADGPPPATGAAAAAASVRVEQVARSSSSGGGGNIVGGGGGVASGRGGGVKRDAWGGLKEGGMTKGDRSTWPRQQGHEQAACGRESEEGRAQHVVCGALLSPRTGLHVPATSLTPATAASGERPMRVGVGVGMGVGVGAAAAVDVNVAAVVLVALINLLPLSDQCSVAVVHEPLGLFWCLQPLPPSPASPFHVSLLPLPPLHQVGEQAPGLLQQLLGGREDVQWAAFNAHAASELVALLRPSPTTSSPTSVTSSSSLPVPSSSAFPIPSSSSPPPIPTFPSFPSPLIPSSSSPPAAAATRPLFSRSPPVVTFGSVGLAEPSSNGLVFTDPRATRGWLSGVGRRESAEFPSRRWMAWGDGAGGRGGHGGVVRRESRRGSGEGLGWRSEGGGGSVRGGEKGRSEGEGSAVPVERSAVQRESAAAALAVLCSSWEPIRRQALDLKDAPPLPPSLPDPLPPNPHFPDNPLHTCPQVLQPLLRCLDASQPMPLRTAACCCLHSLSRSIKVPVSSLVCGYFSKDRVISVPIILTVLNLACSPDASAQVRPPPMPLPCCALPQCLCPGAPSPNASAQVRLPPMPLPRCALPQCLCPGAPSPNASALLRPPPMPLPCLTHSVSPKPLTASASPLPDPAALVALANQHYTWRNSYLCSLVSCRVCFTFRLFRSPLYFLSPHMTSPRHSYQQCVGIGQYSFFPPLSSHIIAPQLPAVSALANLLLDFRGDTGALAHAGLLSRMAHLAAGGAGGQEGCMREEGVEGGVERSAKGRMEGSVEGCGAGSVGGEERGRGRVAVQVVEHSVMVLRNVAHSATTAVKQQLLALMLPATLPALLLGACLPRASSSTSSTPPSARLSASVLLSPAATSNLSATHCLTIVALPQPLCTPPGLLPPAPWASVQVQAAALLRNVAHGAEDDAHLLLAPAALHGALLRLLAAKLLPASPVLLRPAAGGDTGRGGVRGGAEEEGGGDAEADLAAVRRAQYAVRVEAMLALSNVAAGGAQAKDCVLALLLLPAAKVWQFEACWPAGAGRGAGSEAAACDTPGNVEAGGAKAVACSAAGSSASASAAAAGSMKGREGKGEALAANLAPHPFHHRPPSSPHHPNTNPSLPSARLSSAPPPLILHLLCLQGCTSLRLASLWCLTNLCRPACPGADRRAAAVRAAEGVVAQLERLAAQGGFDIAVSHVVDRILCG